MSWVEQAFVDVVGTNPVVQGLVGGLVIATLNLVGAALVFVWRNPTQRAMDAALGGAAGVMLAASFTSLIIPGIEAEPHGSVGAVVAGIVLGVVVLDRADAWVPHVHVLITGRIREDGSSGASSPDGGRVPADGTAAAGGSDSADAVANGGVADDGAATPGVADSGAATPGVDETRVASVLLFIVAVTLHNMPEGLAVGVGFGSGNLEEAIPLMLAIGIQNVPEGLAVSVAAINAGFHRRFYAVLTGLRAGLVEIPLAVFGAWAVTVAAPMLPYAMGFAAGGMLYVISDEIIPETHANGNERLATLGTMAGLLIMLYLDVVLAA